MPANAPTTSCRGRLSTSRNCSGVGMDALARAKLSTWWSTAAASARVRRRAAQTMYQVLRDGARLALLIRNSNPNTHGPQPCSIRWQPRRAARRENGADSFCVALPSRQVLALRAATQRLLVRCRAERQVPAATPAAQWARPPLVELASECRRRRRDRCLPPRRRWQLPDRRTLTRSTADVDRARQ
jgi:hypothetical protein